MGNDGTRQAERDAEREALRQRWRAAGIYRDLTVSEAISAGAANRPDDQLVFAGADGTRTAISLGELQRSASRQASALVASGVRPGDVVAVQASVDRRSTELLEALWMLGAVIVPLGPADDANRVDAAVRETGARVLVTALEWREVPLAERAAELRGQGPLELVFVLGRDAPPGTVPLEGLSGGGALPAVRPAPSATCCVLYTSGSTASAKGVRHSHETLLAGLVAPPSADPARMLATFPAGHVASLMGLLRPLLLGGTTVVMDRWSAPMAAELIEEYRLTSSAGTPFFLSTLLDEADRRGRDISSLVRFLVGAAPVSPDLVARADQRGIVTWRTYGSTEHPAIASGLPDDPPSKRRLTDGRPMPGNEVRLVDETGTDVAYGHEGEIVTRGPKQFLGYQDPVLDVTAFDGSWFRTGDLGRFDAEGYLTVTGRLKDIVIRGGENISALEVEQALTTHPDVREAAVCAMPDQLWGEQVCAFVIPDARRAPALTELAAHFDRCGLAPHKVPAALVVLDDFPRTATGKVNKRDLLAFLPAREPDAGATARAGVGHD